MHDLNDTFLEDQIFGNNEQSNKDFEDAIQILCASSIENINCIITRNGKDFKGSEIPVLSPDAFFLNL